MANVLCDPNYKPTELYGQVEGLLLYYDKIFLYAPSKGQLEQADPDSSQRLIQLVEAGLVVPVGRSFWFDPDERGSLANRFADNPEKASTYAWTDFDEKILSFGHYPLIAPPTKPSNGFLVVSDDHRNYAEEMERSIPRTRSAEFKNLVDHAAILRDQRRLPDELLHGPLAHAEPERLAERLVYSAAGDLRLCENLSVESVFSTPEMGEIYRAIGRNFISIPEQSSGQLTILNPFLEYRLTEEELQMAARLATQVSQEIGPLDLDLLLEYRNTSCSQLFRQFVAYKLASFNQGAPGARDDELKTAFDAKLNYIESVSDWAPYLGGITVAALGQLLVDEKLQEKSLGRRGFFAIVAGLSLGILSDRILPNEVESVTTKVIGGSNAKMFALVKEQRDRQRRRSGRF